MFHPCAVEHLPWLEQRDPSQQIYIFCLVSRKHSGNPKKTKKNKGTNFGEVLLKVPCDSPLLEISRRWPCWAPGCPRAAKSPHPR